MNVKNKYGMRGKVTGANDPNREKTYRSSAVCAAILCSNCRIIEPIRRKIHLAFVYLVENMYDSI